MDAISILKLCVEAFERRYRQGGLNTYDDDARLNAKQFIKEQTGEVYDFHGNRWVKVP